MLRKIIAENIEYLPRTRALAKAEMNRKHQANDLGWFWAVAKPLMYIVMFYLALSLGFKSDKNIDGAVCPYYVWLATGISCWFYIQDLFTAGANCFTRNRQLISNYKYPASTLPMVLVIANLFVHLVMVCIVLIIAVALGVRPCIYWLQLPFFILLNVCFVYIWCLLTGLLNTLSTDILAFIRTIKPAFFWLSGILFNSRTRHSIVFKYNPITFLVEGYRDSICFNMWFWEDKAALRGFIIVITIMILATLFLFRKLEDRLPELV